jgi:hypothetical protein
VKSNLSRALRQAHRRLLPRTVGGALLALATAPVLLDHRRTGLTGTSLAPAAGAIPIAGLSRNTEPPSVRVRHVPDPGDAIAKGECCP